MRDTNPTRILNRVPNHPLVVSPEALPVTISRIYTDVDGTVIDKAAAPAAMQVAWPVYVLGAYDRNGGYRVGRLMLPPVAGAGYFLFSFVAGLGLPFPYATGLNTVNDLLTPGDLVQVWTDNVDNPTHFVFIVQNIRANTAGYGSVLYDTINNERKKYVDNIDYYAYASGTSYDPQFNVPLRLIRFNEMGNYRQDDINPLSFKDPIQFQQGFIRIPTRFELEEKFGFGTMMQFGTDTITFNLNIR